MRCPRQGAGGRGGAAGASGGCAGGGAAPRRRPRRRPRRPPLRTRRTSPPVSPPLRTRRTSPPVSGPLYGGGSAGGIRVGGGSLRGQVALPSGSESVCAGMCAEGQGRVTGAACSAAAAGPPAGKARRPSCDHQRGGRGGRLFLVRGLSVMACYRAPRRAPRYPSLPERLGLRAGGSARQTISPAGRDRLGRRLWWD